MRCAPSRRVCFDDESAAQAARFLKFICTAGVTRVVALRLAERCKTRISSSALPLPDRLSMLLRQKMTAASPLPRVSPARLFRCRRGWPDQPMQLLKGGDLWAPGKSVSAKTSRLRSLLKPILGTCQSAPAVVRTMLIVFGQPLLVLFAELAWHAETAWTCEHQRYGAGRGHRPPSHECAQLLARASTQSVQGLRVYVPCLAPTRVASGLELFRLWKS